MVGNHFYKQLRAESAHKAVLLAGIKHKSKLGRRDHKCSLSMLYCLITEISSFTLN